MVSGSPKKKNNEEEEEKNAYVGSHAADQPETGRQGANSHGHAPDEDDAAFRRLLRSRLEWERDRHDVDPEKLARKLDVLKEGEKVERRSRKTRPKT